MHISHFLTPPSGHEIGEVGPASAHVLEQLNGSRAAADWRKARSPDPYPLSKKSAIKLADSNG
jgi:hypothetical protein